MDSGRIEKGEGRAQVDEESVRGRGGCRSDRSERAHEEDGADDTRGVSVTMEVPEVPGSLDKVGNRHRTRIG